MTWTEINAMCSFCGEKYDYEHSGAHIKHAEFGTEMLNHAEKYEKLAGLLKQGVKHDI